MNVPMTVKKMALLFLGFEEEASPSIDEVNKSYKRMSLICHPDTGGNDKLFKALTVAKEFLVNTCQAEGVLASWYSKEDNG